MYARIASFEGGDTEGLRRFNEERLSQGTMNPPKGMNRVLLLASEDGSKRLFVSFFDSKEDLEASEERFESMGDEVPEELRGRRVGVERFEVVTEQQI